MRTALYKDFPIDPGQPCRKHNNPCLWLILRHYSRVDGWYLIWKFLSQITPATLVHVSRKVFSCKKLCGWVGGSFHARHTLEMFEKCYNNQESAPVFDEKEMECLTIHVWKYFIRIIKIMKSDSETLFIIKMSSYQHRNSYYKDKIVSLYNGQNLYIETAPVISGC